MIKLRDYNYRYTTGNNLNIYLGILLHCSLTFVKPGNTALCIQPGGLLKLSNLLGEGNCKDKLNSLNCDTFLTSISICREVHIKLFFENSYQ